MAVAVSNILARGGQLLDQRMMRRQMADRIGGARVARDQKGLAAAAAEVMVAARATLAGLLHPVGAAERRKGRR